MPRYLNSAEGVSGKSGSRKGHKSGSTSSGGGSGRRRNQPAEINNNGRPKSAVGQFLNESGASAGVGIGGAANFDTMSEVNSESGRLSIQDSIDDDAASITNESVFGASGEITEDQWALLEEKLKEHIENATHKNTNIRGPALKNLEKALSTHYLPDFLENWKITVSDCIERLLRKGTAQDGRSAVKLASLLALQLGQSSADAVVRIMSNLKALVNDPALSDQYKADCALALGVCTFVAEEESDDIISAAESLRTAWNHVKIHSAQPEAVPYFSSAVASWVFVLLQAPTRYMEQALSADLPKLASYFESNQLEIRIAAGEAIAVLYEMANDIYSDFRPPSHPRTLEQLEQMATESTKHYAKRDRRMQRATFREIYAAVKNNESPKLSIKFHPQVLNIETWSSKLCYDIFCQVLSGGMTVHLKENVILRDVFDLGPPLPSGLMFKRMSKTERQSIANTVSKARTLIRGKQRDKRVAAF